MPVIGEYRGSLNDTYYFVEGAPLTSAMSNRIQGILGINSPNNQNRPGSNPGVLVPAIVVPVVVFFIGLLVFCAFWFTATSSHMRPSCNKSKLVSQQQRCKACASGDTKEAEVQHASQAQVRIEV